jgi:hypothetical protein
MPKSHRFLTEVARGDTDAMASSITTGRKSTTAVERTAGRERC